MVVKTTLKRVFGVLLPLLVVLYTLTTGFIHNRSRERERDRDRDRDREREGHTHEDDGTSSETYPNLLHLFRRYVVNCNQEHLLVGIQQLLVCGNESWDTRRLRR